MIPFHHNSNFCNKDSKLISHKLKDKCFTKDELFLCLYVDDGALPFLSILDALLGSEINYREMSRLGLTMHVGRGDKESKTEAVFFPSRAKIQSLISDHEKNFQTGRNLTLEPLEETKKKRTSLKKMKVITDKIYANAKETHQLILKKNSYISFTPNFKYLESLISYYLTDLYDILCRIKNYNQAMGALRFF